MNIAPVILVLLLSIHGLSYSQETDELDAEFAAMDAELDRAFETKDEQMEQAFQQVKLAVDRAYNGLTKKIEVNWGEDVVLPEKTSWTTYNDDFSTRASFDFEQGVYRVETVVTDDVAFSLVQLKRMAKQIAHSKPEQLKQQDVLYQKVSLELDRQVSQNPQLAALMLSSPKSQVHVDVKQILPRDIDVLIEKMTAEHASSQEGLKPKAENDTEIQDPLRLSVTDKIKKLVLTIPFINGFHKALVETQLDTVKSLSREYRVDASLIMAIIETESSFNPMATSPIPAYGLMQLVPSTGAVDAYQFVYGEKKVVSAEYLYNQDNNLRLGTAYLHLLTNRYLGGVVDPQSRLYCVLASYNIGIGNLAHTLIDKKSVHQAVKKANTMKPAQLYDFLYRELPAQETRDYLVKVLSRKPKYNYLDGVQN